MTSPATSATAWRWSNAWSAPAPPTSSTGCAPKRCAQRRGGRARPRTAPRRHPQCAGRSPCGSPAGLQPAGRPCLRGRLTLRTLGVGDPAGLLARRADIAAAERNLAAATARIGVETAGLYPQVEVRGSIGLVAGNLDALDESGTSFNVLNPVIRWALLDRGRVRARIAASEARAQEALILYDRTVLRALQETDDAFNGYGAAADRLRLRLLEATANREAARLARERFVQGDGEYLDVLEAERSDYLSRRALSIARTEQRLAVVGIYKALGGGWEACAGARRCGVATDDTSPGVARQRDSRS